MRIGGIIAPTGPTTDLDRLVRDAQRLESQGFYSAALASVFTLDAIGALTVVGRETQRIELMTAVVPTYPRHPFAIAQQALTAQVASRGRFVLGIGLSHRVVIENMLGFSYDKPAKHMREYLEVLAPLLRGEPVAYQGEQYRVNAALQFPGVPAVPLMVAALGPRMLELTGRLADGTITWMTGPKTLESLTIPTLTRAAAAAGRPAPRVVASLPVALTSNPDKAREIAAKSFAMYGQLPSYRAMLDREGAAGPADVAIVGDEKTLERELRRLAEIGVTDFGASGFEAEPGAVARTMELMSELAEGL
jgi:F420-dependent oxidoreductase-like protein